MRSGQEVEKLKKLQADEQMKMEKIRQNMTIQLHNASNVVELGIVPSPSFLKSHFETKSI